MDNRKAIIIGAGPAGLTAAYELLIRTDIKPIILEATDDIGGISKTVNYKGNRIDIGGHRFFSKSDRIIKWWTDLFPVQGKPSIDEIILQKDTRPRDRGADGPNPEQTDQVMLVRNRISRILFLRKFFDYPLSLNIKTLKNLGFLRTCKVGMSYILSQVFPLRIERSLEDFFINRFGTELYKTFFRDYTAKVWGIHCKEIKPAWGAQRVKGLSISKALLHAARKQINALKGTKTDQKQVETSLIEEFYYPKFGPGQLWEEVAGKVRTLGGEIFTGAKVDSIITEGNQFVAVKTWIKGTQKTFKGDFFFSTMPIKDLIQIFDREVPVDVRTIAQGLPYRDFIIVGLLLKKLSIINDTDHKTINNVVPDNWMYIQESDVKVGRVDVFNNWSPYMVKDLNSVWLGLEYFCNEGDELWAMADDAFIDFASDELEKIDIIQRQNVLDACIIRMPKAYPAYFGTYDELDKVTDYLSTFDNLFLIGRNGMHRYNNMDHSMLTAMMAVDCIQTDNMDKKAIWSVNMEEEYHEEK